MPSKAAKDLKETKRFAVAERLKQMHSSIDVLSGMWSDQTLDILIVILGIGHVEIDEDGR